MGLSRQVTCRISMSPDNGGEASYVQWDTRPSWVFRIRHPVGAQGRQRCRAENFPEAGSRGGSRNPVPVPGRDLRCAEERGSGCLPRVIIICARNTVISRTDISC